MYEKSLARDTAVMGLFIALQIITTRFMPQTPYIRIDLAFIPIALCAMLYGPIKGGGSAALGDVIGFMLFPPPFPFFPGFTFSAFITGVIFGLFLYRRPKSAFRFAVPVIAVFIIKNLGLDTLWVLMITSENFFTLSLLEMMGRFAALMPVRLIHLVMVPVQVITLTLLWEYAIKRFESRFVPVNDPYTNFKS